MRMISRLVLTLLASAVPLAGSAQSGSDDLAKQLSNPVASLISVPFQLNYDQGLGPTGDGHRTSMNIQPVIPISLNGDWNLISRTIIPLVDQTDVIPGTSQSGVGDVFQSFFFSPKAPTSGGLIWGAGPAFLLPTHSSVSGKQFAAGITGVALKQNGPWTFGILANQIWSVGGSKTINSALVQPFMSYSAPTKWSFGLSTEVTYDWTTDQAAVPINLTASKLTRIGRQPISIGGGVRYWVDSPAGGPKDWGARLQVNLLFPK